MTWFCQQCRCNNSEALDHCRLCQQHWETVWSAPKRRRSASKHRGKNPETKKNPPGEKTKDKEKKSKAQESDVFNGQLTIFSEALPWVTSTPQSRLPRRVETAPTTEDAGMPLPPAPILPAPPGASTESPEVQPLNADEQKIMSHLQALQDMQAPLSDEMAQMLQTLTQRNKESTPVSLSHSQLNRMSKLRGQVTNLRQKVTNLDGEWSRFINGVLTSAQSHAQMYRAARSEMVTNYHTKMEELQTLKANIATASQHLCAQIPTETLPEAGYDIESAMETMRQLAQCPSNIQLVDDDTDGGDMESEELQEDQQGGSVVGHVGRPRPRFNAARSPNRVANQNLKPDRTDRKERKAKEETKTK